MVIFCMHFATNTDMIVFIDIFHNKLWWGVCGFLFFFFCFLFFGLSEEILHNPCMAMCFNFYKFYILL